MILVIDNGSQYTHLIKRNCRDLGFETEILNSTVQINEVIAKKPDKIILSGGPSSVFSPTEKKKVGKEIIKKVFEKKLDVPLLGICFGHQLIAHVLGGEVKKGASAGYGLARVSIDEEDLIFRSVPKEFNVWVSHFDEIRTLPNDFEILAHSQTCKVEAMKHKTRNIFSVQFHPEVWHTENGEKILSNFLDLP